MGVNQHGLVVAIANRPKAVVPAEPRSRGLLCRELLGLDSAKKAAKHAFRELASGAYAGASYLCADAEHGLVVYGGNTIEVVELTPGLHLLSNGNLNDYQDERQEFARRMLTLQRLDSAVAFLAVASRTFSRKPNAAGRRGMVIAGSEFGTVSFDLAGAHRAAAARDLPVRPRSTLRMSLRRLLAPFPASAVDRPLRETWRCRNIIHP